MNPKTQLIDNQIISFSDFDNYETAENCDTDKIKNSNLGKILPDFQLIFLHGWASNKELWTNLIDNLFLENNILENTLENSQVYKKEDKIKIKTKLKLKILTIDLPGFGTSQRPKSDWFVSDYANFVSQFIKRNCQKNIPIIIIGHSFGGRIAIKLLSEELNCQICNKLNPKTENLKENSNNRINMNKNKLINSTNLTQDFAKQLIQEDYKIEKLILISSAGFVDNSLSNKVKKVIAKNLKPLFQLKSLQNLKKQIYQKILKNDDYLQTSMKQIFVNIIDEDLSHFMKEIKVSTLLIFGDKDEETPPSFGQRMNKLIANSTLHIINGDHFAFVHKSKEIAVLIDNFLH